MGWVVFAASVRLNVGRFFQVTGVLLLLVSAGLVAHGVHELQEAAVLPTVVEHLWDVNHVLDESSTLGVILKSLFGYNGNPSLLEVISYLAYGAALLLALAMRTRRNSRSVSPQAASPLSLIHI